MVREVRVQGHVREKPRQAGARSGGGEEGDGVGRWPRRDARSAGTGAGDEFADSVQREGEGWDECEGGYLRHGESRPGEVADILNWIGLGVFYALLTVATRF